LSVMAPSGSSVMRAADFRLITDSLPHLVWMAGPDGLIDYFNRQCAIYAGCGLEPNGGWNGAALIHPDDVDRVLLAWRVSTQLTSPYNQDCRIRRHDGEYRWHALRGVPIRGLDDSVIGWIGTATDADHAKRSEDNLRLAERRSAETSTLLEMLQAKAPVGFAVVDRDVRLLRVNETMAVMCHSTAAELVGQTVASFLPALTPAKRS
jgi:two-component system NtrC family sensor kinase